MFKTPSISINNSTQPCKPLLLNMLQSKSRLPQALHRPRDRSHISLSLTFQIILPYSPLLKKADGTIPEGRSIRHFYLNATPRSAAIMTGSRGTYLLVYQSSRRSFLDKYILSPGFTPKASYHMSMWGSAPLTRHSPRAWGSLFVRLRISFSVMLAAQTPE